MGEVDVLQLVALNAVIDSILGLVIGLWLVARKAGQWARRDWTAWLDSDEAEPYLGRVADSVISRLPPIPKTSDFIAVFEPRLQKVEQLLSKPVEVDLGPIVEMVTANIIPKVKEEVATIRSVIEGKIGWVRKVGKQTGEAIAEVVGEEALEEAGVDREGAEMMGSVENMLNDSEWCKKHPGAAFGLRLLKKRFGEGGEGVTLQGGKRSGKGLLRLRR